MNVKRRHFILAGVIVFFTAYYLLTKERVILSDVSWTCDRTGCMVDFQMENRTRKKVERKLAVRAFRKRLTGKGAFITDIVGEVEKDVSLLSGEKRSFSEHVALVAETRVDLVSVSHFEPRMK